MAVPIRMRDACIERAQEEGRLRCDRCSYPLGAAGKPGQRRRRSQVRVDWKVMIALGGEKNIDNLTILCGDCVDVWRKLRDHVVSHEQWSMWIAKAMDEMSFEDMMEQAEEEVTREREVGAKIVLDPDNEEDSMFIAELEAMKEEIEKAKAEEKEIIPSQDEPMDKEAWLSGDAEFPPKEEVDQS